MASNMTYKFGGRRSRGCNPCRSRKVKCGEERPACARCTRMNKECVYRETVDLLFHDETNHASARANRLWHARAAPDQMDTKRSKPASPVSIDRTPSPDSLWQPPPFSYKEVMVQRFIYDFVVGSWGLFTPQGFLDFAPDMYSRCQPGSSLMLAFEAAACANLCRRGHAPHMASTSLRMYGQAIESTRLALDSPRSLFEDETLLSCHMLAIFEMLAPPPISERFPFKRHNEGTLALAEIRQQRQIESDRGFQICKQACIQDIVGCLRFCRPSMISVDLLRKVLPRGASNLYLAYGQVGGLAADYLTFRDSGHAPSCEDKYESLKKLRARTFLLTDTIEMMWQARPSRYSIDMDRKSIDVEGVPPWLRSLVLDERGPSHTHLYASQIVWNLAGWTRWSRLRCLQIEIHTTVSIPGSDWDLNRWISTAMELLEDFCSAFAYMLMPMKDVDQSGWDTTDRIRGISGFFLVRILAATKMTLRLLARLGVYLVDRSDWVDEVCQLADRETGMKPFMAPDPLDLPWMLPQDEFMEELC